MAYAINGLVRKNLNNKVTVMFIIDDVDDMFKTVKENEGFVMTHVESLSGTPVFYLNGEQTSAKDWSVIAGKKECEENDIEVDQDKLKYFNKRLWGVTISQMQTFNIWVCKKVRNIFSEIGY